MISEIFGDIVPMKRTMIILLALMLSFQCSAQRDSLLVMFWNVENFFSPGSETPPHWSKSRFSAKCDAISKIIFRVAEEYGRLPDAIGFAEVENGYVLKRLVLGTGLRKLDYGILHFDSPDHRGIDCALLYRKSTMRLEEAAPKHLKAADGSVLPTRDILMARFDSLAVLVNHHPSKVGDGSGSTRTIAMERLDSLCDSLENAGCPRMLAVGDFNDTLWPDSGKGTIKYNGGWEKIDGFFQRGLSGVKEDIFDDELLLEPDKSYGGVKPRRTYSGPRYLGGVSDHLPIVVTVYF